MGLCPVFAPSVLPPTDVSEQPVDLSDKSRSDPGAVDVLLTFYYRRRKTRDRALVQTELLRGGGVCTSGRLFPT